MGTVRLNLFSFIACKHGHGKAEKGGKSPKTVLFHRKTSFQSSMRVFPIKTIIHNRRKKFNS